VATPSKKSGPPVSLYQFHPCDPRIYRSEHSNGESRKVFSLKGMNHICPKGVEQVSRVRLHETPFDSLCHVIEELITNFASEPEKQR
jgi:hypothetical protein